MIQSRARNHSAVRDSREDIESDWQKVPPWSDAWTGLAPPVRSERQADEQRSTDPILGPGRYRSRYNPSALWFIKAAGLLTDKPEVGQSI
jgi:hypothetical protein